ncbi:hypothetical protein ACOMHN_000367 [Nucella lapillus]
MRGDKACIDWSIVGTRHEKRMVVTCLLVVTCGLTSCELLRNGGFEQKMTGWDCWGIRCEVLGHSQSHHGAHAIRTHNRTHHYQGPSQTIQTEAGNDYRVQSWVRLLNDLPNTLGQTTDLEVSFHLADNSNSYINIAIRPMVTAKDGWSTADNSNSYINIAMRPMVTAKDGWSTADNSNSYINIAMRPMVTAKDGWILIQGEFQAPPQGCHRATRHAGPLCVARLSPHVRPVWPGCHHALPPHCRPALRIAAHARSSVAPHCHPHPPSHD